MAQMCNAVLKFCFFVAVFVERCIELSAIWSRNLGRIVNEIRTTVISGLGWETCDDPCYIFCGILGLYFFRRK